MLNKEGRLCRPFLSLAYIFLVDFNFVKGIVMKISDIKELRLGSIVYFSNDVYEYVLVGYSYTTVYFARFIYINDDVIPLIGKQILYNQLYSFSIYELQKEDCFLNKSKQLNLSIQSIKFQMLYGKDIIFSILNPDMRLIDAMPVCTCDSFKKLHMYLSVQNGCCFYYMGKGIYVEHTFETEFIKKPYMSNKDCLYEDFGLIKCVSNAINGYYYHYVKIDDQYGICLRDKIGVIGTTIKKDISDIFRIKDYVRTDAFTELMVERYDKAILDYVWENKNDYRGI